MNEKKLQEMVDEVTKGKEFDENQIREIRKGIRDDKLNECKQDQ